MINMHTKFEVSSLSRSRDILGGLKSGSRDVTMPISGTVYHQQAGTCYVQRTYQI